jgi:putative flippase GtrA
MPQHALAASTRRAGAFLVVGGVAFAVDAVVFNLLVFWTDGSGPLYAEPLTAKIIAIASASVVTYVGNHWWTFADRHLPHRFGRYAAFVLVNAAAIGAQLGCLAISRYVLGLEGPLADNISGTLIGQGFATVMRFVGYDRWVFRSAT